MAQISSEKLVISVSQIVKNGESAEKLVSEELAAQLEEVITQLISNNAVVEVVTEE